MVCVRPRREGAVRARRRRLVLATAAVGGAWPLAARAADVTSRWASPAGGSWENAANWTNTPAQGGFPNNGNGGVATYAAVIDAAGGPYAVSLGSNVTVESFTLNSTGATLNHTAGQLTATGAINLQAGTYSLNGGSISNSTINLSGAGTIAFTNSAFNRISNVTVNGGALNLGATGARLGVINGATFNGGVNLTGGSSVMGFFNTITIPAATYNLDGSGAFLSTEGAGTMTIPAGATVRGGNGGGIWFGFISGGSGNGVVNQGTIRADVTGTTFTIFPSGSNPFTNTGTIAATNGATLVVSPPSWSSTGTLLVNNGTANLGGTFTSLGTINRTGGQINVTGTWDNTGRTVTLDASTGDVRLANGTFKGGTANFSGGALVVPANNLGRFDGAHVNGSINLTGSNSRLALLGNATATGPISATGDGAVIGLFTGATAPATTYNLDGVGAFLSLEGPGSGTATLPAGASVRGGNNGGIWYGFITDGNGATLDNRGSIVADLAGKTFTVFPSGSNKLFNSGSMSAVNGATLAINAATWTNTATGRISATNSTLTLTGNWTSAGSITVNNSALTLGGSFTSASLAGLSRTGGTVSVTGVWDNTGNTFTFSPTTGDWTLSGGTVRGGSINFTGGARMRFGNSSSNHWENVTLLAPLALDTPDTRLAIVNAATFAGGDVTLSADNAVLGFFGAQTLSPVTYNVTGSAAYLSTESAATFTIPAGATVRGGNATNAGIWHTFFSGGVSGGTINNQGTIRADVPGGNFSIYQTGAGNVVNTGVLAATNGGRLIVYNMRGPLNTVTASGAGSTVRFSSGTYTINQNLANPAGTTLYFGGAWTKSATIDVGGFLVFDYDLAANTPIAALRAQVVQGYNGGAWNGGGFNSTAAAANPTLAIGYADTNADFPSGGLFGGQVVDNTAVVMRLTRYGDADLNGVVNLGDFNRLAANFGLSNRNWAQGDFNYDGLVNLADFNRLAANFGLSAAGPEVTPEDWARLGSAVPEPASGPILFGVAASAATSSRRRRARRPRHR